MRAERARAGQRLFVDALGLEKLLQEADLVVGVEDGEVRLQADQLGMAAQDAGGDRMEGAEPDFVGGIADHRLQPLAHFARRLVGEGDREDLAREGAAQRQDMRQARRQDPGLAGAGAGQHQHRPVDRLDGLTLRLVEAIEMGGRAGRRRGHRRDDRGEGSGWDISWVYSMGCDGAKPTAAIIRGFRLPACHSTGTALRCAMPDAVWI